MGRFFRKYNVKFLSEGRSKSDCTFFVELWRSIVRSEWSLCQLRSSSECKVCVTVSDGGDIKATALCEVGWRIMEIVCQLHSRAPVRKVLNVKFVSRGQFALAEKISRGRSTILNFQRHFLFVKQLISQQTNFWHRCDNTTRIYFISTEKLISQPLMWCGFSYFTVAMLSGNYDSLISCNYLLLGFLLSRVLVYILLSFFSIWSLIMNMLPLQKSSGK